VPTAASAEQIRSDFDAIARLMPEEDRLGPHDAWLLKQLPKQRGAALEIGCGVGHLARKLADKFDNVVAIDFSEGMIDEAKRRGSRGAPIEYACADMFEWLPRFPDRYDCIITVGTLHHVDLKAALREMKRALKPGGTLLVSDILDRSGWRFLLLNGLAYVIARVREMFVFRGMAPWKLRKAYWRHGENETYLKLDEVERVTREELPRVYVRGHLLWRYTIVWQKPYD
jgi:2-polyprenyl-3-methyl-5-hydroxy-6-metoxy-1,4-benzoquinol methylase